MDHSRCEGCPLQGTIKPTEITGNKNARFLVVTDTPSFNSAARGRLLSPEAGKIFSEHMQAEGFKKDDFAFVAQVRCAHDAEKLPSNTKKEISKKCRGHLLDTVAEVHPKVIIPLGAEAAKQTEGKSVKITRVRGISTYSEEHKTNVFPMISPLQVALYPQNKPIFAADCNSFGRLLDHNFDVKAASNSVGGGRYQYIDDLEFLIKKNPKIIAYDTETTSLRWYAPGAKILTMQFCIDDENAYLLPWKHPDAKVSDRRRAQLKKQFIRLMCSPRLNVYGENLGPIILGQNTKYDVLMTHADLGVRLKIGGDTLMLATLLDENSFSKSLDMLVKRYYPMMSSYSDYYDSTVDKSRMAEQSLDDDFLDYGAGDAFAVFHLSRILLSKVSEDKNLLTHYQRVSLPALNMFAALEMRGMPVDERYVEVFEQMMRETVAEQYDSLIKQVPRSIKRKQIADWECKVNSKGVSVNKGKQPPVEDLLKFSRGDFIRDILFYHEDGFKLTPKVFTDTTAKLDDHLKVPSTSTKQHLPFFYDECTFAEELTEYIQNERLLTTNVLGFKNKYIQDGLVRPTYNLITAVTGRISSKDPNGTNIPKRGKLSTAYRRMFVAPEGKYWVGADESQLELRIAAHYANERAMIEIYKNGGDIHKTTGAMVLSVTLEEFLRLPKAKQKSGRQSAKAVGFGYLFGMWWKKFKLYAKTQYGVEFTDQDAKRTREGFFKLYPGLVAWHEKVREHVRRYKQIQGITGRIRHLPTIDSSEEWLQKEAERQAINAPVQGSGSDLGLMAIAQIHEDIDEQYLAPISFVHDYVGCFCNKEHVLWAAQLIKRYMEDVVAQKLKDYWGVTLKCPLLAEASFGENMGDEYELEGLQIEGDYDFTQFVDDSVDEKTGVITRPGIVVPFQETPPNNGLRQKSYYTEVENG